jgi:hypothetical protein
MEVYQLEKEVKTFYVEATSFPDGVKQAWETLHSKLPSAKGRNFYGISHGSKDGIVYKAAVEENIEGEAEKYGCEAFVIPKGDYLAITIHDYMNHLPLIGQAFRRLLAHPQFDGITPCVEWYKSDEEVICMVKKKG